MSLPANSGWHSLHTHDSTHIWLRQAALRVAAELDVLDQLDELDEPDELDGQ